MTPAAIDWRALPKVELHLHLEGAAPPALARARAEALGRDAAGLFDGIGGYAWRGFSGFLAAYERVAALFDTPEAQRELAEAVLAECARNGVIYAEVAISPDLAAGGDAGRWREHLAAIGEGAAAAEATHGIEARWIATCIRDLGPARARACARLAVEAEEARIVGLGLAGDERAGAPGDFRAAFALAREAGLGLTAHAGEFAGPESVRAAMADLDVDRIDHGVRAFEDPDFLGDLAAMNRDAIDPHLAMCPGSNLALGVVGSLAEHPIGRVAWLDVSVSTDDPPFFGTTMTREVEALAETFGWGEREVRRLQGNAAGAAFCDHETFLRVAAKLRGRV